MASRPRVFTIPASAPFLTVLIDALMNDKLGLGFKPGGDPLALADVTIYLPTRRAVRLLRETFLDIVKGDAAILPRLVSLNDVDADEIMFAEAAGDAEPGALEMPEALQGLERQTLLAQLILKWVAQITPTEKVQAPLVAGNPRAAMALAQDLARLMDDMTMRQVDWSKLDGLVPEDLDTYWQLTLKFLKLVHEPWQGILAERNLIEPAARRDLLITAETNRLATLRGPVIAAGSTGSIPSTAKLLTTIAHLPQGVVILPGLDTNLDTTTWEQVDRGDGHPVYGHPQFGMHALLRRIGILRDAVEVLGAPAPHGREMLASEALRPATASELWRERLLSNEFTAHADDAFKDIAVIEAGNAEEEALSIAIALREAMETKNKTAALVTPDRALARRVLAALSRWNVPVDDSGGDALADTPVGVFARLVAEAALDGLPPITLLAMLKHEQSPFDRRAVVALERSVLRGSRPRQGTEGLAHALKTFREELGKYRRRETSSLHRTDARTRLTDAELDAATALADRLRAALQPLEALSNKRAPFAAFAKAHGQALQTLRRIDEHLGGRFDAIEKAGSIVIEASDYAELFHAAIAEPVIRRPEQNVRVRIFGPLEARLQSVDRLVLGGLVEGVWPPETRADPWLSRPMRQELGLDLPERRIGLSAHDFAQALGAPEIILSRAARQGGAPTVASRFVQRLAAVAGGRWSTALKNGEKYLALARSLDEPQGKPRPVARPEPKPPFEARPKRLTVTEIEDWLRDPYTIYARHVLKLRPLDDVDTPPGAADRGTLIHGSIGDFAKAYAQKLPDDPVRALTEIGERHFAPLADYPEAKAFWWPRFRRIVDWFARYETERRGKLASLQAEIAGSIKIPFGNEEFELVVRADRIECLADGRYAILDYKTGAPPTTKQVQAGLAPQLTLEAAILRQGGFDGVPKGESVAQLLYVRLSGGARAGEEFPIQLDKVTPDEHADKALEKLTELLRKFADPATPYYSLLHPMWATRYGDYDHLARVPEWSMFADENDIGGGE
ncbi:double-strand break repair protein AddB [Rhodoplanes sp. Z2-YC6860]|uniref:double-strand break repair protein AddB n=1 Tax=Rhodoplanes sp. Z2-YC6860 TaxID=674703 RepID=UPI00078C5897|nr:double-strand break repair protein AddB [Rhodoplanes sp. Z2-YC6860]AMN38814.1 double-strand break repair protein AddB [Rhodoplanes sp. Z2-YC6860]